jgi:hypothetical protein
MAIWMGDEDDLIKAIDIAIAAGEPLEHEQFLRIQGIEPQEGVDY